MKNVYKPENIYIVSASMDTDPKLNTMIDYLEIPRSNTFSIYDEGMLERVYEEIRDVYLEGKSEGKTIHSAGFPLSITATSQQQFVIMRLPFIYSK